MSSYRICWLVRSDIPKVLEIEQGSFKQHWTEADFLKCLRQRNCIGMVAKVDEQVVGFMLYQLYADKLHILNFAVDPHRRRQKIGSYMVQKLKSKLTRPRRRTITLEVGENNLSAQQFFREMGFKAIKPILRGFYEDTGEDAYTMKYTFVEPSEQPPASVNRVNRVFGNQEAT